ncbi:MAG: 1-acyl-sn-glycerol-3-phosphate acyltransferase [Flavobacteriales bacterium]|nr:1-acyl-sn-glycerol-3-phosphate acyltransferase [Flavobacteriales bacterium]
MGLFKRNPFGQILFIKRLIIFFFGIVSYRRYNSFNKLKISNGKILHSLPNNNVLFVSNHQTYFADVAAMFHVFAAANNGYIDNIDNPMSMIRPKLNLYFVAAKETMTSGILPKIFAYAGAIMVQRTWREAGQSINRKVDSKDTDSVGIALDDGWVITFPQGTTRAFNPGRKGTAYIIKQYKPTVIPIVIDGFRRAYDKKGLNIRVKGVNLSMSFKDPLDIDYENESVESIMDKVMNGIEQAPIFNRVRALENTRPNYPKFPSKDDEGKSQKNKKKTFLTKDK